MTFSGYGGGSDVQNSGPLNTKLSDGAFEWTHFATPHKWISYSGSSGVAARP